MTKAKPVMKVEPAGLSPTFPVIEDLGILEMALSASIAKPAAESRLTGAGDVGKILRPIVSKFRGVPDTNEEVLAMTL